MVRTLFQACFTQDSIDLGLHSLTLLMERFNLLRYFFFQQNIDHFSLFLAPLQRFSLSRQDQASIHIIFVVVAKLGKILQKCRKMIMQLQHIKLAIMRYGWLLNPAASNMHASFKSTIGIQNHFNFSKLASKLWFIKGHCTSHTQYFWQILQKLQNMMDERITFKMIMLGGQGVGKSSMVLRYIKGSFSQQYQVTVGVEFATKTITVADEKAVKLQIWDTSGQQAFKAVVRTFYKGIAGVFLVFSIDNEQTLEEAVSWFREVREHAHEQIVFFLVGAKSDLQQQREVSSQMIEQSLRDIKAVFYVQTSAKLGTGIEEMFSKAAQFMYKKFVTNASFRALVQPNYSPQVPFSRTDSVSLKQNTLQVQKKNCC